VRPVSFLLGTEEAAASRSWHGDGTIADLAINLAGFDGRLSTDPKLGFAAVLFTVSAHSEVRSGFSVGDTVFADPEFFLP